MTTKAVNVIADHLADHVVKVYELLKVDFLDEDVLLVEEGKSDCWIIYFDGVVVTEWGQC